MIKRKDRTEKSIRIGLLGVRILLILEESLEPVIGAAIWEELEAQSGQRLHSGSVYTTLKRMRQRNLISKSEAIHGKPVRAYKITTEGINALTHHRDLVTRLQSTPLTVSAT